MVHCKEILRHSQKRNQLNYTLSVLPCQQFVRFVLASAFASSCHCLNSQRFGCLLRKALLQSVNLFFCILENIFPRSLLHFMFVKYESVCFSIICIDAIQAAIIVLNWPHMQTPYRKAPGPGSNPQRSSCTTALTTAPLCRPCSKTTVQLWICQLQPKSQFKLTLKVSFNWCIGVICCVTRT